LSFPTGAERRGALVGDGQDTPETDNSQSRERRDPATIAEQSAHAVDAVDSAPAAENRWHGAELAVGARRAADRSCDLAAPAVNGSARTRHIAATLAPISDRLRALITIQSPLAPERYAFPISGDVTSLQLGDGSVIAYKAAADPIATLAPPWAVDANGVAVPTHFELDGTMVVQVVDHRDGDFAYAITADPW
jgi:hypothetical protein